MRQWQREGKQRNIKVILKYFAVVHLIYLCYILNLVLNLLSGTYHLVIYNLKIQIGNRNILAIFTLTFCNTFAGFFMFFRTAMFIPARWRNFSHPANIIRPATSRECKVMWSQDGAVVVVVVFCSVSFWFFFH